MRFAPLDRSGRLTYIAVQQETGYPAIRVPQKRLRMENGMTDITLGTLPTGAAAAAKTSETAKRGFFRRLLDAMVEARMRQAEAIVKDIRRNGIAAW